MPNLRSMESLPTDVWQLFRQGQMCVVHKIRHVMDMLIESTFKRRIIVLIKDPTHHLEESKARIQAANSDKRKLQEMQYQCIDRFDQSGHYVIVFIVVSGKLTDASVNVHNALGKRKHETRPCQKRRHLERGTHVHNGEFLREKRMRWFRHVQRRYKDDATKKILQMTVDGKRSHGRPNLRWRDL